MRRVRLFLKTGEAFEGVVMPPTAYSDPNVVVLKLRNGYNVGFSRDKVAKVEDLGEVAAGVGRAAAGEAGEGPPVALIATGGTILSRVEYATGAVYPSSDPGLLLEYLPDLPARLSVRVLAEKFSEDMAPGDWAAMASAAAEAFANGAVGVVMMHGTDTMHYSAAALAFALRGAPGPVVFVGAQRSSDRPSSDAFLNLRAAVAVAASAPFAESVVAMHASSSDGEVAVHRGVRVRKMHASRRDAFQSVGGPLAVYDVEGAVLRVLEAEYRARGPLEASPRFEEAVALVKFFPGMHPRLLDVLLELGVRGVVLEGTGFGHVSERLLPSIKRLTDAGVVVAMASQTLHGRVNLYVYRRGRELLSLGVVPVEDMLPEVAYVKLSWLLANLPRERVPEALRTPMAYEMSPRSPPDAFGRL